MTGSVAHARSASPRPVTRSRGRRNLDVPLADGPGSPARRYAYQVVEELTRCGCEVVFVHQNLGEPRRTDAPPKQGVFAEYERALIHERARAAAALAARHKPSTGEIHYGYTYIHKTTTTPQHLRVNEAEAEVVREIYRWRGGAASSYAIHRRLTLQGVPPRKSKHSRWAQRRHRASATL